MVHYKDNKGGEKKLYNKLILVSYISLSAGGAISNNQEWDKVGYNPTTEIAYFKETNQMNLIQLDHSKDNKEGGV